MRLDGLQSEMQAMMAQASNNQSQPTINTSGSDFGDLLGKAINSVNGLQKTSSSLQTRFDQGDADVSLSDVMIARNKASVSFDATIQVRNKMVDAYKELMNMPV
ncbi:flagellar hook-basal body complex protein FliE [Vibrio sp. RC27]